MINIDEKPGWVRIFCDGGCGRRVELRLKKVVTHDFYVCNSKTSSALCIARLPPRLPGQLQADEFNAAAAFMGISYRWPDAEEIAAVGRAQNILAAGLVQKLLERLRE